MFARVSSILALALCASASVLPRTNQCETGQAQCCNSVQQASNPVVGTLAGLLGVILPSLTGQVGLNCNPLILGGNSCTSQAVCCTDNHFNGLIAVGCTPINLSL